MKAPKMFQILTIALYKALKANNFKVVIGLLDNWKSAEELQLKLIMTDVCKAEMINCLTTALTKEWEVLTVSSNTFEIASNLFVKWETLTGAEMKSILQNSIKDVPDDFLTFLIKKDNVLPQM